MKQWLTRFWELLAGRQLSLSYKPPQVFLVQDTVEATARLVASYGTFSKPHEGIAYWAGISTTEAWIVTTVLAPDAVTTPGSYKTSSLANAMVVAKVNDLHLQILAQIHGHPTEWVDHSRGDDVGAFMPYHGFYSVVVPHYGRQGLLPLSQCGVHRYAHNHFVRLTREEIQQQFVIVPTSVDLRRRK